MARRWVIRALFAAAFAATGAEAVPVNPFVGDNTPITATGGSTAQTLRDITASIRSIKSFGATCNGTIAGSAADDAAFTKAFTNATSPGWTVFIPAGLTCVLPGNTRYHPPSGVPVNLVGQGTGLSKILIAVDAGGGTPGPAAFGSTPQSLFDEPASNGAIFRDFTIDAFNATSAAATNTFSMNFIHCGLCFNTRVENVEVLNMNPGMAAIALDGPTRFWVRNTYITQTPSHSNGKGIWIGSSSGTPSGGTIEGNTLVGTNTLIDGNGHRITNNDISGWGYGSALGLGINIAGLANNRDSIVSNNYLHDSMVGQDVSSAWPSGLENWAQRTVATGNVIARNSGTGIGSGGLNSMIANNIVVGNGTGGVNQAGIGGAASGAASPAGTMYAGNHSFDDGTTNQKYGYQDFNNGLGAQTLNGNDFTGNATANYNINANNAPSYFYIPSLEPFFVLPAAVGNGADLTADTVNTTTIPALKLAADGDRMHIRAGGSFNATTDNRTTQIKFGGALLYSVNSIVIAQSSWSVDIWVHRKSATTQDWTTTGGLLNNGNSNGSNTGTAALVLTSANDIVVTCQNTTNATALSAKLETMTVEIYHQTK